MLEQKLNDLFKHQYLPNIHKIINENISNLYRDLSFLKNFDKEKNILRSRNEPLEITDYLGFDVDCSGTLRIYFYYFDDDFNILFKSIITTYDNFITDSALLRLINDGKLNDALDQIIEKRKDEILTIADENISDVSVYNNDAFYDFLMEESLCIVQKQLNNFLNSRL